MSQRKAKRAATRRTEAQVRRAQATSPRGGLLDPVTHWSAHHHRVVLLAILALYALLAWLGFEPQPHTGGDNAGYITLARSLLERGAYLDLYDPAEPPHTKYPPVFPALLAAGMLLGLKPWVGLKLIVVAMGGGAIAGTYLWIRRRGRPALALGVALLLAFAPGVLREVHWVLSDVPFWCLTALAQWAFERLRPDAWRRFALALALTVLAYFTRSAGLPLVLAAAAWLAWRRHWRQLLAFGLVLGPLVLLWWLRSRAVGGVQYVGEFWLVDPYNPHLGRVGIGGLFERLGENLKSYVTIHLPILLAGAPGGAAVLAGVLVLGFGIYGWARRLRRARVAELFLPLYLGLILLWPAVWSGERFLLPVLGLLLFYAGDGLVRALGRTARARQLAGAGAALLLVAVALPGLAQTVSYGMACTAAYRDGQRYPCTDPASQEYFQLAEWAGGALPEDAVVLSRKPRLFHVMSGGLQGRNYPMASTTEALLATADSAGARWVVFDLMGGLAQRYLAPAILQRPAAFCVLQSSPNGTVLFGILPDAATIADAPPQAGSAPSFAPCAPLPSAGSAPTR